MRIDITRILKDKSETTFTLDEPGNLAIELVGWDIETTDYNELTNTLLITVSDAVPQD